jgi:hypothetical protein
VPATTLERDPVVVGSAQDLLERLERYTALHRARVATGASPPPVTPATPAHRFDPATVDLFPYDLFATIVAAAATIVVSIALTLPVALVFAAGLVGLGEWSRRARWFPSVGINLVLGAVVGAVLVLVS